MSHRVSLVTGSARGLGLAIARACARRGDRVHVVHRSDLEDEAAFQREFDGRVQRADLTREADARELVRRVLERDGRLDALVHAVGEYRTGALESTRSEDVQQLWVSNVASALNAAAAARAALRSSRGSAVFFGTSGCGLPRAWRQTAAYASAKTALWVLVRSLAVEEAPHGVRVNMISPGHVPHPHASPDTRDPQRWSRIPMGRPGTPEEVARAALWLTSEDALYVTGTNVEVAGGWML